MNKYLIFFWIERKQGIHVDWVKQQTKIIERTSRMIAYTGNILFTIAIKIIRKF